MILDGVEIAYEARKMWRVRIRWPNMLGIGEIDAGLVARVRLLAVMRDLGEGVGPPGLEPGTVRL